MNKIFNDYKETTSKHDLITETLTIGVIKPFTSKKGVSMKMILFEGLKRPFYVFNNSIVGVVKKGTSVQVTGYKKDDNTNITLVEGDEVDAVALAKIAYAAQAGAVMTF